MPKHTSALAKTSPLPKFSKPAKLQIASRAIEGWTAKQLNQWMRATFTGHTRRAGAGQWVERARRPSGADVEILFENLAVDLWAESYVMAAEPEVLDHVRELDGPWPKVAAAIKAGALPPEPRDAELLLCAKLAEAAIKTDVGEARRLSALLLAMAPAAALDGPLRAAKAARAGGPKKAAGKRPDAATIREAAARRGRAP